MQISIYFPIFYVSVVLGKENRTVLIRYKRPTNQKNERKFLVGSKCGDSQTIL